MALTRDENVRGLLRIVDTTGVSTASAAETDLLTGAGVANGFIDLGKFAGSPCTVRWHESAGFAGTLKVYGAPTAATTYQGIIGSSTGYTITASTGGHVVLSMAPKYLRVTATRTTSDITLRLEVLVPKLGGTV